MKNYFHWVFFNPKRASYDTLRSSLTLNVTGESTRNQAIQSTDPGTFYDKANDADNALRTIADNRWQKTAFTSFILLMLGASAYLVLKK
jgi:hypothetical protein